MYLLQLNSFTGLIKDDIELDQWMAIESFRNLVNKKGYGIHALTCVAMVIDYGSIIKNYSEKERPLKAMEIVFNNRKALNWNEDEIQIACIAYKDLQYNPQLEEKSLLDELRISKLNEIKDADNTFKKTTLLTELSKINDLHDSFDKKNSGKSLFEESPARNGYSLLRLEIKILDPKSFYYERKKRESDREAVELEQSRIKEAGNNSSSAVATSSKSPASNNGSKSSKEKVSAKAKKPVAIKRGISKIAPPPSRIPPPPAN